MRFFAQIIFALIVIVAMYSGASIFRIGEPLENRANHTCQMMQYKQNLARQVRRPGLFVIGASNVTYGIRSELLSQKVGLPVVNLGLPASLGINMIFASARSVLKPGDVALLNIEHFFFIVYPADGPFFKKALFQCPTDAYRDLEPTELIKMFVAQAPLDLFMGVTQRAARLLHLPLPFVVTVYPFESPTALNKYGDFPSNTKSKRTREMEADAATPGGITLDFSLESDGVPALRQFVKWAREHDIRVVVSWPAVYWPSKDKAAPGLVKLRAFYESLGLPVLGDPMDTMRPLDEFFKTNSLIRIII